MTLGLRPADAVQAFIDELGSWHVIGSSLPDPLPSVFLRVVQVGGFQRDLVTDTFTVTLEAFAKLESAAGDTLAEAVARVEAAVEAGRLGNETAYRLQVAGLPSNLPLPSVPSHKRYISTLVPDLRRRSITI